MNQYQENNVDEELLFTPAAILDLLGQIPELSEFTLGMNESLDGKLQLVINDSTYEIEPNGKSAKLEAEPEVVDEVAELNDTTYQELGDDFETYQEPIESGIIKEALKTLLIGGVVRLGKAYLKN